MVLVPYSTIPCWGLSPDLVAFNTLVDFHARQGRARAAWMSPPTVKSDLLAQNLLGKLDYSRFRTFQYVSKRFKTVQWCPKPFARWETQRRRWAGLYRFLEIEVKTAFQWIERLKESGCGTGRLHWVHSDSFCISVVKFDQSGDLGWFGDVRWKLSHLEVLVQIFSPTAQWHCTQAWIVAQNTH